MDARVIVIIGRDRILQELLKLSGDNLDVFVTHSTVAPPVLTDGSLPQVLIIDFDIEGSFELLSELRFLPRTAIIGLTHAAEVSRKLKAASIQMIFGRDAGTETLVEAVRACLDEMPAAIGNADIQILIVDDEKEIRDILNEVLKKHGYRILKTGDGEVALQMIEKNPDIALVLLDIRLPGCGGMTVLAKIREEHPDIAVIMITGLIDREVAQQSIRLGAFDYIVKPLDVALLPDVIAAALSHREYIQRPWWKRFMS
jgi:CheY-like chemotaxis protein